VNLGLSERQRRDKDDFAEMPLFDLEVDAQTARLEGMELIRTGLTFREYMRKQEVGSYVRKVMGKG